MFTSIAMIGVIIMSLKTNEFEESEILEEPEITVDLTGVMSFSVANYQKTIEDPRINVYLHPERIVVSNVGIV